MEIQPSAARPRRKPLQPLNTLPDPPASRITVKPKPPPPIWPMPAENRPPPASLAEELEAIRRRNERLRLERDRTEAALRARDEALERGLREMERRWVEQKRLEQEVARLVKLKELGSSFRMSSPFKSLREIELEKRRLESPIKKKTLSQSRSASDIASSPTAKRGENHPVGYFVGSGSASGHNGWAAGRDIDGGAGGYPTEESVASPGAGANKGNAAARGEVLERGHREQTKAMLLQGVKC